MYRYDQHHQFYNELAHEPLNCVLSNINLIRWYLQVSLNDLLSNGNSNSSTHSLDTNQLEKFNQFAGIKTKIKEKIMPHTIHSKQTNKQKTHTNVQSNLWISIVHEWFEKYKLFHNVVNIGNR